MAAYFLPEMNTYGTWQAQEGVATPYRETADTEELRATGRYRVVQPEQFIAEQRAASFCFAMIRPRCGGIPAELALRSLRLFEDCVLPRFR
jgi:hypothetical protein